MQDVHVGINFTNQMVGGQPTRPTGGWRNHIRIITMRQKTEGSSRPVGTWYGHAWAPTRPQTSAHTQWQDKGHKQFHLREMEVHVSSILYFVLFCIFRNTRDHFFNQKSMRCLSVLVQAVGPQSGKRLRQLTPKIGFFRSGFLRSVVQQVPSQISLPMPLSAL